MLKANGNNKRSAKVSAQLFGNVPNSDGENALFRAVGCVATRRGVKNDDAYALATVKYITSNPKFDRIAIAQKDSSGNTAFHVAASRGDVALFKLLEKVYGGSACEMAALVDDEGNTPLRLAASKCSGAALAAYIKATSYGAAWMGIANGDGEKPRC